MYTFLARQPIFDQTYGVFGYELLYRNGADKKVSEFRDGNSATRRVLSDAITTFGLDSLTNSKPAFVNFTGDLILEEFPTLADPKEIVVELLEDIKATPEVVNKVARLKEMGYTIALDDYIGSEDLDALLPYADILKVDFMLTDRSRQKQIAERMGGKVNLLAEKVETSDEFNWAKSIGYSLFQGYFFSYPNTFKKKIHQISTTTFAMLMCELGEEDVDFRKCTDLIHTDTVLTYKLLQRINTMNYQRANDITDVGRALVIMGVNEFRRWLMLVVARDCNQTCSDELSRESFVRGMWAESLALRSPRREDHENAFLMGMFSLLDQILDDKLEHLLGDISLDTEVVDALLKKESNFYSRLLQFVVDYENGTCSIDLANLGIDISEDELHMEYAHCLAQADTIFNEA